jgi:hypothetical protein
MQSELLAPGPEAAARGDVEQLEVRIQGRLSGRVRDLRLVLRDDGLVLRGWCRTYYVKQVAQHAVMDAAPWRLAANEIQVS